MVRFAYCIVDRKACVFNSPVFYLRHGQAIRDFQTLCADLETLIGKYPDDFALYCVGSFDDETGKFLNLDIPEVVASGSDFAEGRGAAVGGEPPLKSKKANQNDLCPPASEA